MVTTYAKAQVTSLRESNLVNAYEAISALTSI